MRDSLLSARVYARLLGVFSHVTIKMAIWDRYNNSQFICKVTER